MGRLPTAWELPSRSRENTAGGFKESVCLRRRALLMFRRFIPRWWAMDRNDLSREIRAAGVIPGGLLALHSSMKRLGWVDGGPNAVIDAFVDALGPDGTLMVPTFTYGPNHVGRPFDPETSEPVTGLIPQTFWRRPDAVRSIAPVHSVAAIGARALELTRDHLYSTTLGRQSPFHRLAEWGGSVMLLGCDHTSNSLIHVAESLAEIPYIYTPSPSAPDGFHQIRQRDGRIKKIQLTEFTGCSKGFFRAELPLRTAGVIRDGRIGQAAVQVMKASDVLTVLPPLLRADPCLLLCDRPGCGHCVPRRASVRR